MAAYAGLDGSYVLPLDHDAIEYSKRPVTDRVSKLRQRIRSGEVKLPFDPDFGYLPGVLDALGVPVSSQVLVFSKTSFQASRIGPRTPRALYFSDDVTIGYVRGGDVLEFTAQDPEQGTIFYTLDQEKTGEPMLTRRDECLQCHASGATLGVPGLMVRSVVPDRSGMPVFQAGTFISDHRSPLSQRWGGWYVTGTHAGKTHMGNAVSENKDKADGFTGVSNLKDLTGRIDTGAYLSPHSDIVALMVLEHQTRMQNLLTRVGWETRMALLNNHAMNVALKQPPDTLSESTRRRINNAAEELVKYMLFTDEVPLEGEIRGASGFAEAYSKQGPRDSRGRSLYQLDLRTRLLKYPCSPLIYSAAFDQLPEVARNRVRERMLQILNGDPAADNLQRLSAADRKSIREILHATKPGF